jgi:hypothetical protein
MRADSNGVRRGGRSEHIHSDCLFVLSRYIVGWWKVQDVLVQTVADGSIVVNKLDEEIHRR